jgi:hypothetical protein
MFALLHAIEAPHKRTLKVLLELWDRFLVPKLIIDTFLAGQAPLLPPCRRRRLLDGRQSISRASLSPSSRAAITSEQGASALPSYHDLRSSDALITLS